MKGIDKIKKKIMADANASSKKFRDAAKKEIKALETKQQKSQDEYKDDFDERTAALVEGLKQKSLAKARLDVKKELLHARETIIDAMIDEVIAETDTSGTNYKNFLKNILLDTMPHLSGAISVKCNTKDAKLVNSLVDTAKVESDPALRGGLVFEDATGKRVDESLDAALRRKRDDIRQQIVGILNG